MNRKKRVNKVLVVLLLAVIFCVHEVAAKPVKEEEAKQFAKNWVLEKWKKKVDQVSTKEKAAAQQYGTEGNLYYVISFPQGGWVIISGDDVAYPVIAFSPTGTYSEQNRPIQFQEWMENVKKDIASAIKAKHTPQPKAAAAWKHFNVSADSFAPKDFSSVSELSSATAGPLLSTTWDQGKYYNQSCPIAIAGPNSHVWAGCVATAMAQVMKYYNYPPTGSGSHSYVHPTYGLLSANFGTTTYNWNSMPNSLSGYNSDVAKLLYHVGVSVDMNYAPDGSGAYTSDTVYALKTYFKYSSSLAYIWKSNYSTNDWTALLRTELDNQRPVLYRGEGPDGGHAFVCDGYSGSDYFHFNWGWSGYADGYFYLNSLTPGSYELSSLQAAVIGISPPFPVGSFDSASCDSLVGWTKDPDTIASIDVHFYADGPASTGTFLGSTTANIYRADLSYTDKNHGFSFATPFNLKDGQTHQIYVYAIDDQGGTNPLLTNSPKSIQCSPINDLTVISPSASKTNLAPSESFTFSATVKNSGTAFASASILRWYRSSDATISTADTQLTSKVVGILGANQTSAQSATLIAPAATGTYWLGACVDAVSGEASTTNNCSTGVQITVAATAKPDLTVISPSASKTDLVPSESFTFSATVKNSGTASAAASTLHWYRSTDSTISTADTQLTSKAVGALSANQTSALSATLTAPATIGTYWLGACVDAVIGEASSTNNCSTGVQLTVATTEKPDLTVTSITSPATVESREPLSITAQFKNQGAANALQTSANVYYMNIAAQTTSSVHYENIPALAVNQTLARTMGINAPCKTGDYFLAVCINPGGNVESDQNNNCAMNSLTVTGECQQRDVLPAIQLLLQ